MNAYGMTLVRQQSKGDYDTSRTQLDIQFGPPNSCYTFSVKLEFLNPWSLRGEWFGLLPNSLFFARCVLLNILSPQAAAFSNPLLHMRVSRDSISIRTSMIGARSILSIETGSLHFCRVPRASELLCLAWDGSITTDWVRIRKRSWTRASSGCIPW